MTSPELDQAKLDRFGQKMADALNGSAIALMASIGHQTGLFDTMATMPPATSAEIARVAGLQERYVREWLAALVAGRVIDYAPDRETYVLPPEHAALLTRSAGPNNVASGAQIVALLGEVEQGIVASFRSGGGVPYSQFPRFQQMMAELSDAGHATLVATKLPLIPGMAARLKAGSDVADIGCGHGRAITLMAQAFPNSRFTGYDFSEEAIAVARAEAARMGLPNARFVTSDVAALGVTEQFDLVTAFDSIHDQARPAEALRAIAASLRAGGAFFMAEATASSRLEENLERPMSPWMYTISCMHCMTVSLAQEGAGLGNMWGEEQARAMLADTGFVNIVTTHLTSEPDMTYYIAIKE